MIENCAGVHPPTSLVEEMEHAETGVDAMNHFGREAALRASDTIKSLTNQTQRLETAKVPSNIHPNICTGVDRQTSLTSSTEAQSTTLKQTLADMGDGAKDCDQQPEVGGGWESLGAA